MARKYTIFQNIDRAFSGNWNADASSPHINSYDMSTADKSILYRTTNKDDYESKKLELQQNTYLKDRWVKANVDLSVSAYAGLNNVKLMYRDADLMDAFPEIGAALDIVTEESTITSDKGMIVNVYSKSDRIKSILEDLFVNRLNIQVTAPMVVRAMCKYGNQFMLLDIDNKLGVKGWKQLPVFNVERIENGIANPYGAITTQYNNTNNIDTSTKFIWVNENNSQVPFRNWQIAHFRLLTNSLYLPYGCLVGDTRIETEYGYKEIKDIKVGDKVWTFNVDTQKRELSTVTMWMNKGEKDTIKVLTNHNYIEGTPDHKVLVYEDKKLTYKEIKDISIGDLLVVRNGVKKADAEEKLEDSFKLEKVKKIEASKKQTTYDITVDSKNSNFFANGIVTHNCSYLNGARRHWRMLSLMEDLMLIYRLERSIERRVYKIYVGAIDDADVQAYVENIANNFKRTPIIDPMTGQLDLRKNILPVHKDTPIPLLDGRTITIENLAKEFENGKENYVYSVQDKTLKIVPGKVVWCGKNYTAEKLIRITLDDGSHFDLAAEHELIMRDGTKKRADEVSVGESVMPFYRKVDKDSKKLFDRYEKVFNPNSGKYEFTHRIIAETVEKGNEQYNTVHHKDFNKYNNSPSNLMWMDYHEHHKMHGDLARKIWKDPIKRKSHIENLSKACRGRIVAEETKEKISKTIKSKYASGEFDFVKEISRKNITEYNKSEKGIECRRKQSIKLGYREEFKAYNESELHKQHDEIRKVATTKSWEGNGRTNRIQKMNIHFDDFIWDSLRDNILHKKIVNRKTMLEYINNKLIDHLIEINNNKRLEKNHFISREVLENRIRERGFCTITEYIKSMLKNHKIAKIETIEGDDVYCMTVVGQNGEEDRHNFAIRSLKSDGSLNDSGCFVSNCADQDIFIPVRDQNAPTPIDTLSAAQNLTAMDDIKFVQDKVCTALRIPKTFLNFEEAQGNGNNLALEDIRFTRTVNRIQQAFLMELTKVASIHLYLLGFTDDLTNFNLTMNNPSTQAEQLEIDNLQKKITAARDAISDPGNGIPIMSQTRALKEIMKWSEKDIKDNLEEIRLEKGIAAELEKTSQIIKRTGLFDTVDRMYGEPGAEYQDDVQQQGDQMGGGGLGGGGGAPMGGGDFGSGLDDLGAPDSDENGDIAGAEGSEPTADMESGADTGGGDDTGGNPMESRRGRKPILAEAKRRMYKKLIKESEEKADKLFSQYLKRLDEANEKKKQETLIEKADIYDKSLMINEEFNKMLNGLNKKLNENNEKADD